MTGDPANGEAPLAASMPQSIRARVSRLGRRISLSQRFFLIALCVVVAAMLILGNWTSNYVSESITKGIGGTAAASIEALISRSLDGVTQAPDRRTALEAAFAVGNSADATRLIQIRVRNPAGEILFESLGDLDDVPSTQDLAAAALGVLTVRVIDVPLQSLGALPRSTLPVLKIYTPLRRDETAEVFGVAELYFSARAVRELQAQARSDVWIIVASIGFVAVGTLALLVQVTGDIITQQRQRLAANLRQTRSLLDENMVLQAASERLRVEASLANEHVLAQVGSDIHDGPVQLLTLLILRLTRADPSALTGAAAELAREALEELRGISAGLVLPELAKLGVAETIALAAKRHEDLTGTAVVTSVDVPDITASITAKVCAYRVIQQALNNAYRHGGGVDQQVRVSSSNGWLRIEVTNRSSGKDPAASSVDQLGLRAMRFRVESQGGSLAADFEGEHARIDARIPIDAGKPQASSFWSGISSS